VRQFKAMFLSGEKVLACRDRRDHPRFGPEAVHAAAWIQPLLTDSESREPARVLNLSASGICIQTTQRLTAGSIYGLLLDLGSPLDREVQATVGIKWVRATRRDSGVVAGAEFITSDSGWFGPDTGIVQ
jgi:hypothetical protein